MKSWVTLLKIPATKLKLLKNDEVIPDLIGDPLIVDSRFHGNDKEKRHPNVAGWRYDVVALRAHLATLSVGV